MKRRAQPLERLVDANPRWVPVWGDPAKRGVLVEFDCPIHEECQLHVPLANPLGGGPPFRGEPLWQREGETFETLTLSPSVRMVGREGECRWHGFIRNGRFETCGDSS